MTDDSEYKDSEYKIEENEEQNDETLLAQSLEGEYPVIPLRNVVLLPGVVSTLFIGREESMKALEASLKFNKHIVLLTQKDSDNNEPKFADLYDVGTVGRILQDLTLSDGTIKVLVESISRIKVERYEKRGESAFANVKLFEDKASDETELKSLVRTIIPDFMQYARASKKVPSEILESLQDNLDDYQKFSDLILHHLPLKIEEKQQLLEMDSLSARLEALCVTIQREMGLLSVEQKIKQRVRKQMEKSQHEYYLNEQMKAIQKELGDADDEGDEVSKWQKQFAKLKLSSEAKEKVESELKKLRLMGPMSAEAAVVRNYLDWIASIPWKKTTKMKASVTEARKVLDDNHYGTEKVKDRILEHLAVQKRLATNKSPILCFVGPPGVGKTSLGSLIAKATGRKFVRISLGGVRDEAEIRGHRRTYVGAMPGKIIQGMKKADSSNPLFLLDEIDKLGADWRGDPSSALLETLDPEQNKSFGDHFLEVEYDLSNVMFVTTANSTDIPRPLLDRMELIRISGYTEVDKMEIAKRHVLAKVMKENGLKSGEFSITDGALKKIIREYTREAGVRNLERQLSQLARKVVWDMEKHGGSDVDTRVTATRLHKMLGVPPYRFGRGEVCDAVGIATGLAWTEVGGDLLTIESVAMPGGGKITKTGKLGDVMLESIEVAGRLVKSRAADFGIKPGELARTDIHLHVPEGAVPKDGPSAGIAIVTSIVSLLTGVLVRHNVAMTGEITLQGRVLPIGGLKEKLLAALQRGIKNVLIPQENVRNLEDVPQKIKGNLNIIPVENIDEVLQHALSEPLTPIEWKEEDVHAAFFPNVKHSSDRTQDDSGNLCH